jgi:hypothetical protein
MKRSEYVPWRTAVHLHIMLIKGLIEMPTVPVLQYLTIIHRNYDGGGNQQITVAADDSGGWRQQQMTTAAGGER